jgi:hypothetical protein
MKPRKLIYSQEEVAMIEDQVVEYTGIVLTSETIRPA